MGMPPAKLGLVYAPSGIRKFIQLVGPANTRELFFTAKFVDAGRALQMGLVNYLVPRDELEEFTLNMARDIAGKAPLAVRGMKRIINLLLESGELDEAGNSEAGALIAASLGSDDLKEGQRAFLEKRKPVFRGQ
jgi:enoyl-CoA hydratase/carnithine racemase